MTTLNDALTFIRGASITELDQLAAAVGANKQDRLRRAVGINSRVRISAKVRPKYLAGVFGTVDRVNGGKYHVVFDVPQGRYGPSVTTDWREGNDRLRPHRPGLRPRRRTLPRYGPGPRLGDP
jgi:hypothetical protein